MSFSHEANEMHAGAAEMGIVDDEIREALHGDEETTRLIDFGGEVGAGINWALAEIAKRNAQRTVAGADVREYQ